MAKNKRALGSVPEPVDPRDYHVSSVAPILDEFPKSFRIPYPGKIKDQGDVGSCVAHSLAYIREVQEAAQTGEFREFSPGFVYANRRPEDHQGSGMMPREALSSLRREGNVYLEDFPYNEEYPAISDVFLPQRESLLPKAYPLRVSTYAAVNDRDRQLKSALMQLGPVTACYAITAKFQDLTAKNAVVRKPKASEKTIGYHQMTVMGWREDGSLIILNSWGEEWGDGGYCYMSPDYPCSGMWSVTDAILPENAQPASGAKTTFSTVLVEGVFRMKNTALVVIKRLRGLGLPVFLTEGDEGFGVRVGYFYRDGDPEMQKVLSKLDECGIACKTVRK